VSDPFIAAIRMWGLNFAPRGWAFCSGQMLPISQNTALFSILGTTYGGDGRTTLGLPDLRGRAPMHPGNGPGLLFSRRLGQKGGYESVTLNESQLPSHAHTVPASSNPGDRALTMLEYPAVASAARGQSTYAEAADGAMAASALERVGGGQLHENMQPFLTISFCIALTGTFPSRS
jgi:microcystin-dependent protein